MAYDPEKDKVLKKWKCDETGLIVSINRYGDGEAKVQIGPRILLKKDGSERAPVKAGRLTGPMPAGALGRVSRRAVRGASCPAAGCSARTSSESRRSTCRNAA